MPGTSGFKLNLTRFNGTTIGVLCTIVFLYWSTVACVIVPWFSYSVPGVLHSAILTITAGCALFCYLACVLVDPGRVPPTWEPEWTSTQAVVEVKKKARVVQSGETRFCQKCKAPKPPRTHHCRICHRCVLRMDHHCPWMNNCIGHCNYKAFILFLLYANAAIVQSAGLHVAHTLTIVNGSGARHGWGGSVDEASGMLWAILLTVSMALCLPVMLGLLMLLCWNLYLVCGNKTTIEYHEGVTAKIQALKSGHEYLHPYDLGVLANLRALFGPSVLEWLAPGVSAAGNGLHYATRWDADAALLDDLNLV